MSRLDSAIRLDHIRKYYNGGEIRREVFDDVSLEVKRGEFIAVVGQVGSGKTTLINLITGLDRPANGQIHVGGVETTNLQDGDLANIRSKMMGVVYQTQNLMHQLTVYENVELPLILNHINGKERHEKVIHILELMHILKEAYRKVGTLSVGERQMVAIARSLVTDPPIILMDEPTETLDPLSAEVVMGFIRGANMLKDKTLLITTHDKKIMSLAQKVVRIRKRIP